jgi:hypothetical protein
MRSCYPHVKSVALSFLLLCGFSGAALAQLSREDIEALRRQAKAEGWTFVVGENEATGYSIDQLCGALPPLDGEDGGRPGSPGPERDLPSSFDWRDYDGCTPIRNQGGCGSCWAFSAIGATECAILINDGVSTDLSEQWLVSCTSAGSCNGGWATSALGYICCNDSWVDDCGDCGPVRESDFPYVAWDAPCNCPYPHPYRVDDWAQVGSGIPAPNQIKQAIYNYGPVSVTVAVGWVFQSYDGGIFNYNYQGSVNHAVVLVGWDDNQGSDGVWFLRNSWGTGWGEDGYMRIEYGCSKVGGSCAYILYRYDCNENGIRDDYDIADCDGSAWCGDCNNNDIPDVCDLAAGTAYDCNGNGVPDECDTGGASRVYVDINAEGANTGASWEDALTDIWDAYCYAQNDPAITEVWVAKGTYTPAGPGGDRSAAFTLMNGVALRGGFAGSETLLGQRDPSDPANWSILSGDLDGDDQPGFINNAENSYHVVNGSDTDATAVLDGFVISGGNANGTSPDDSGGGMYNQEASPTIINCMFLGNYAVYAGGAMRNDWEITPWSGAYPTITNCLFSGNEAGMYGGAISNVGNLFGPVSPTLTNCSIVGNYASQVGGMFTQNHGEPHAINCILWGNSDLTGQHEAVQASGCVTIVDYCCIQGLTGELGGVGNIGDAPLLMDADGADDIAGTLDDDVRLMPSSPCTDAGDNLSVPADVTTDLDGNPRFVDDEGMLDSGNPPGGAPIVDIGAYEFQGTTCFGDIDGDNDIDIGDLSQLLANYGMTSGAAYTDGDLDRDGDVDLSDLSALLAVYGTPCG